ncbi:hypothetical protein H6G33_31200 [Calothrix sp. FACHB-1219]|uniref:hypothetical protein n=1 Tax=unclassified Calothrix TaxID=2619626 RepID=UPI00168760EF|nr:MULTISPECIES: hypothetical protein [unclassified Calothrix]MBD2206943.1 hypothetical protein [Calothrix sp. FACHB-168]MBD2221441.1 hypothetical protein [Calothrix sp. FACHB-1219]
MSNPKNRFHDLEQRLYGNRDEKLSLEQGTQQQSEENSVVQRMIFDHNEPIILEYQTPTTENTTTKFTPSVAPRVEVLPQEVKPEPPLPPIKTEVVTVESKPIPPQVSASPHPEVTIAKAETEESATQPNIETEEFLADLQAIVNGEKTYNSNSKQVIDTSSTAAKAEQLSIAQPTPPVEVPKAASAHDVFDQMAQGIPPVSPAPVPTYSYGHSLFDKMEQSRAMANAFDVKAGLLDALFNDLEQLMEGEEQQSLHKGEQASNAFSTKNFSVMNSSGTPRYVEQLADPRDNYDEYKRFLDNELLKKSHPITDKDPAAKQFFDYFVDESRTKEERTKFVKFSEISDHYYHNKIVEWLENQSASDEKFQEDAKRYQGILQDLWIKRVMELDKTSEPRQVALDKYLREHTTLGKVICRKKTQFHEDDSIQVHPAFWGLFIFSPRWKDDVGIYTCENERYWFDELDKKITYKHTDPLFPDISADARQKIYEIVPRKFADSSTKPGIYLHRSKSHGRDDFLVLVREDALKERQCMVLCTKGVGAYAPYIDYHVAGKYHSGFFTNWGKFTELLPFSYSDAEDGGSWRTLGFCISAGNLGTGDTEKLEEDFSHFREMFDYVKSTPIAIKTAKLSISKEIDDFLKISKEDIEKLISSVSGFLTKGFAEPFIVIEVTSLSHNYLHPQLQKAIKPDKDEEGNKPEPTISYPSQIITCAPYETSLRLHKLKSAQDYDYDYLELELLEWQRCYGSIMIPNADIRNINKTVQDFISAEKKIMAEEGINLKEEDELLNQLIKDSQELEERMHLAYKIIVVIITSYVAFLKNGWATDAYTSSFAGRNFNTGPRDANVWGEMARKSKDVDPKNGKFTICAEVDLNEISQTIKQVPNVLSITKHKDYSFTVDGSNLWAESLINSIIQIIGTQLFNKETQDKLGDLAKASQNNNEIKKDFCKYLLEKVKTLLKSTKQTHVVNFLYFLARILEDEVDIP